VLPFLNQSGDAKLEYLSDGITESIINSLSQLRGLRVKSRSAVFRYKGKELDTQRIGRDLGVDAVLIGRIETPADRLLISTELVDVTNGWQLWGEHYDRGSQAIFEVQEEIARQISATLRLKLTGDDEQRITKRYTESTEAYQAYLEGRYYWGKHTRAGLLQATAHFQQAIELDPNYALAYAGIVDCHLRLATNYFPPTDDRPEPSPVPQEMDLSEKLTEANASLTMRFELDRKAAEAEIKRAIELKSSYLTAPQWRVAYLFSMNLFDKAIAKMQASKDPESALNSKSSNPYMLRQLHFASTTTAEEVQIFCAIAREQIEAGNFDAACPVLQRWWTIGEWPQLGGLDPHASADLLLTLGVLAGWVTSTRQMPRGQKHAEALLNGAIALAQQLGLKRLSAEGTLELGFCYYREGLFDLARTTLLAALGALSDQDFELRSTALLRLAGVERHAGRLHDSLALLHEAGEIVDLAGPGSAARYHVEIATTLKGIATTDNRDDYFDLAIEHFSDALSQCEAIGYHRRAAMAENNYGYLLLTLERFSEAESHLVRARKLFDQFSDSVRRAQVDETLARLHVAAGRFDLAEQVILQAIQTLESGGEDALVAEALTTQGLVLCRKGRPREAKRVLDRAHSVAERCGDSEGAGRALLVVIEEMCDQLDDDERLELAAKLDQLLANSQQASILSRLKRCLGLIAAAHASYQVSTTDAKVNSDRARAKFGRRSTKQSPKTP
jgi:TolB-like protein/Flp pilus assembly protein TadD